ncbi:MAG: hypothetical protein QM809_03720 [Gordonia sp. (in: high G+C Gram-positive bacteria)]|uniref:type IV toxin-antitoxin system AbiEi family antitoxin domain-containing protein n=1 Tax=Gordonia sp. (in: high G+C Gram-positive bacteria) TaxID=84139 RepID=UPI0039E217B6
MDTDVRGLPHDDHGLIRREAALAAGFTDNRICRLVEKKSLARLARGVYMIPEASDEADATRRAEIRAREFRLRSIAVVTTEHSRGATVLSHQSAAVVHGLPMLKAPMGVVHLVNGEIGGGSVRRSTHVHAGELRDGDLVEVDGIAVTGLERTAADVAQAVVPEHPLAFAQALVVLDGALHLDASREALALQLAGRRRRGTRIARAALAYADGLAESVGESWGRAQMIGAGLPLPTLQVEHVVNGTTYRVDGDWRSRLVWEFDGMSKYGRYRRPGESVADAVVREKHREDELRAAGIMVVRSRWAMLEAGTMVPKLEYWLDRLSLR